MLLPMSTVEAGEPRFRDFERPPLLVQGDAGGLGAFQPCLSQPMILLTMTAIAA